MLDLVFDDLQRLHLGRVARLTCATWRGRDGRGARVYVEHWARDAEAMLRASRFSARTDVSVRVGLAREELVTVSKFRRLSPSVVEVQAGGVSLAWQHQGGAAADAMVEDTLQAIVDGTAPDVTEVKVSGYVWHENISSQRLCARHGGFALIGEGAPGVQQWGLVLRV